MVMLGPDPERNGESGFMLIEILVSILIFAIVAASLAATSIATIRANATSRRISVATSLIQDRIEQFRSLNPADADDLAQIVDTSLNGVEGSEQIDELGNEGGPYRRSWVVHTCPNGPPCTRDLPVGVAEVEVTVEWNNPERRSISSVAYVCYTTTC